MGVDEGRRGGGVKDKERDSMLRQSCRSAASKRATSGLVRMQPR
jgi:hypothetical protein